MTSDSRLTAERAEETRFDVEAVLKMIPHRYPFLMIDRVEDVVVGQKATGIKCVTVNEPFFQGHFPLQRIMPGVLIVEAMAQTAAVLVVHSLDLRSDRHLVYFMSIDDARFRKPVRPGDVLCLHVEKQRHRGAVWKFSGRAKVEGRLVAEATFTAMIVEPE